MEKILKLITDDFYKEIMSSKYFTVFFNETTPDKISPLLRTFMQRQLTSSEEEIDFDNCIKLGEIHAEKKIPLINILSFMDYFRTHLSEEIEAGKLNKSQIKIDNFDIIKNYLSKGYLYKSIENTDSIPVPLFSVFSTTKIATSILSWLIIIQNAVTKEKFPDDRVLNARKCMLSNYFYKPFFKMIFDNKLDIEIFEKMHVELHNTANSLFYFIEKKDYSQSFYLYADFIEQSNSFLNYFFERLILFEQNKESYFYDFLKSKLAEGSHVNIFTFNIRNMSIINKVWGNENGDYLLNEFEKHIDRLHGMESDNSVFIKTHNAEFLVANFTNEKGGSAEYDETLKKLKSINYKRGEFQPEVRIASSSISFSPDNPLQSEFVKLVVNRSIKESKENNNESLRCDTADMERLVENVKKDEKTRYFIKQAFTQNNFFPFFHTIQSAKTEKPHHVEVLARVCDDNTCMPAGVFIDYLVHTDRVIELDKVILRKLRSNLDQLKNIVEKVFINISPKSLRSTEYILILEDFIKTTKKMNMETVFEITEQSLFDNIEIVKALHKKYDAIFAIDDFGAGYSNFSIVSDLAQEGLIKYIKIDGSLIRNICDNVIKEHIVKGITQVSHLDIVR